MTPHQFVFYLAPVAYLVILAFSLRSLRRKSEPRHASALKIAGCSVAALAALAIALLFSGWAQDRFVERLLMSQWVFLLTISMLIHLLGQLLFFAGLLIEALNQRRKKCAKAQMSA